MQAKSTFSVTGWDEKTEAEFGGGRKVTRVLATFRYSGALEGEGKLEYLMAYGADETGRYAGLEQVNGSLNGHAGSFVVQHVGTFHAKGVTNHWLIVDHTGTGALENLRGSADIELVGHGPYEMTLEYTL